MTPATYLQLKAINRIPGLGLASLSPSVSMSVIHVLLLSSLLPRIAFSVSMSVIHVLLLSSLLPRIAFSVSQYVESLSPSVSMSVTHVLLLSSLFLL